MLNSKSFLSLDFGAGSLKMAEFEVTEAGSLRLKQFGVKSLGQEGAQDNTREASILQAIRELLAEKHFTARNINVCAPGFHVFSKFVKLPPVDTSKVTQIIQYEAQQNVPFPLEEVVWDFQILGAAASGELEVLLVAIKADIVEGLFRTAEAAGLRLELVDVSHAALNNAFRYNYGDLDGCTMLLDIGAKTSNLLFFEKGKVYSRSINIGSNSITQDFATESRLSFADAERTKTEKGFVSLGGAYEEPEDAQAAAISKIARQVMTRLHIQVNQTIQFYRGQQGGSAPARLFLAGGASIMPYTAQFFADKLSVPVEYFNPFRSIEIDPAVALPELEKAAHCFGEVVGLGLRNLAHCPVELNLMPKSSIQKQQFSQKQPYFVAAVFALVLVVFAYGLFYKKLVAVKQSTLEDLGARVDPLKVQEAALKKAQNDLKKTQGEADQYVSWIEDRQYWPELLTELRRVLQQTERNTFRPGQPTGVWIENLGIQTDVPPPKTEEANPEEPAPEEPGTAQPHSRVPTPAEAAVAGTNEVAYLKLTCRGVNLNSVSPSANSDLAFALARELQASPLLDKEGTQLTGTLEPVEDSAVTFNFGVTLKLKRPLKF